MCRRLDAIAVYDDTYATGGDLYWLNSAHRTLEQEMIRSGATSIFPLDDDNSGTSIRNLRADSWYNSGGYGVYNVLDPLLPANGTWNAATDETPQIGPTILNHDQTSFEVIAHGGAHYSAAGPANGGVGNTTGLDPNPGHTEIDGFPFSLEIWCKFSSLDTDPQNTATIMSIIDSTGKEAHLGFLPIQGHNTTSHSPPHDNYFFPYASVEGDAVGSCSVDDMTAGGGFWEWNSVNYYHTGWNHFVATWAADGNCKLYNDGNLIAEKALTTAGAGPSSKIQVRINRPNSIIEPAQNLENGYLAYAATYNIALDPTRIRRHYWAARRPWDIKFLNTQGFEHKAQPNGTERYAKGIRTSNTGETESPVTASQAEFRGSGAIAPGSGFTTTTALDGWKMGMRDDIRDWQAAPDRDTGISTIGLHWATESTSGSFPRSILDFRSTQSWAGCTPDPVNETVPNCENFTWAGGFEMILRNNGSPWVWSMEASWGRNNGSFGDQSDRGISSEMTMTSTFPVSDHNRNGNGWWEGFHHGGGTSNGTWRKGGYTFIGCSMGGGTEMPLSHLHQNEFNKSWKTVVTDVVADNPSESEINNIQSYSHKHVSSAAHPGIPFAYTSGMYPDSNTDTTTNVHVVEQFSTHLALFPKPLRRAQIRELERLSRGKRQMRSRRPTQHLTRFCTIACPSRLMH